MFGLFIKLQAFIVSLIPNWTVVIDTETTSNHWQEAELLQLAIITGSGRVLFNKYFKPETATEWPEAQKFNHIDPKMVKHCKRFSYYIPLVNAYLRHTRNIIGYNAGAYDVPLLEKYGVIFHHKKTIDIMLDDTERRTKPGEHWRPSWRKLVVVARHYMYWYFAHDALEDCLATLHIHTLMHPGLCTITYFLRKIIQFLVCYLMVGGCFGLQTTENVSFPNAIFLTSLFTVGSAYIYGPFIGVLSTLMASLTFFPNFINGIPFMAMALFAGVFYKLFMVKQGWGRILLGFIITLIIVFVCIYIVPVYLIQIYPIIYLGFDNCLFIAGLTSFSIPFYFMIEKIIRHII